MRNIFILFVIGFISLSGYTDEYSCVLREEFIYTEAPYPSCHASTIVETEPGILLSAWFGGTGEGKNDVGIWISRRENGSWSAPVEVASEKGAPCWNPVLFKMPDGEILLFYKAGPSPMTWSGLVKRSNDGGSEWTDAKLLPAGILGPIKNKPILLQDGTLLCGSSVESWRAWACWMETTKDAGKTWEKYGPIFFPGESHGLIQPTLFYDRDGNIRMLCRSTKKIGAICTAKSADGGKTWSPVKKTELPHPDSGIDAVRLDDGRILLIYNHTSQGRTPLNVGLSEDGGNTWRMVATLESNPGEYSYPAVIQTQDGLVHATYTWKRERIKHVVIDPSKF